MKNNRLPRALMVLALLALFPSAGLGGNVYVDVANEDDPDEDGTLAHPFDRIQEGINAASASDKVLVAAGFYKETVAMKDGVSVLGAGAAVTIVDGMELQNSVFTFNGTRQSPLLSGFTIMGGSGDTRGGSVRRGGGILVLNSSPVITQNRITGNVIDQDFPLGGGIYVYSAFSNPQIVDNVIENNVARSATAPEEGLGGGIYVVSKSGDVIIRGNRILSNEAAQGGGLYVSGSAYSTAEIRRNVIRDNRSPKGGGIFSYSAGDSSATIENNLIEGNGDASASAEGGGIRAGVGGTGAVSILHNTLVDNAVPAGAGGALWIEGIASTVPSLVANNVAAGNEAGTGAGGGIAYTAFLGEIRSNLLHANPGGDLQDGGGGTPTLLDNLFTDPLFLDPAAGGYQLSSASPGIDSAEETVAAAQDLETFPRPFDGDGDLTAASDRGAYEYPAGPVMGLEILLGGDSISWPVLPLQEGFHLYRGSLDVLWATGDYTQLVDPVENPNAARFCGLLPGGLPLVDPFVPPPGEGVFYVAAQVIGGVEGSFLGETSSGYPQDGQNHCP